MIGVGVLRASGLLDIISKGLGIIAEPLGIPAAIISLAIVKLFSSSAATGLLLDIFKEYGTDSSNGFLAAIMLSCTETIFYTVSVYCVSVKIKHTRWTIPGALVATLAEIIASVLLVKWIM